MHQPEANSGKSGIPRPSQPYRVDIPKLNSSQNTDSMNLQKSTRRVRLELPNFNLSRDKSPGSRLDTSMKSLPRTNRLNSNDESTNRSGLSPSLNLSPNLSAIHRNLEEEYIKSFIHEESSNKNLNMRQSRRHVSANQSINSANRSMNTEESENRVLQLKNKGAEVLTDLLHKAQGSSLKKAKGPVLFKNEQREDSSPSTSFHGITDRERRSASGVMLQESFPRIKHLKGIESIAIRKPSGPKPDYSHNLPTKPSNSKSDGKFQFKRRNRVIEKAGKNTESHEKMIKQHFAEARAARPKNNDEVFERLSVSQNQTTETSPDRRSFRHSVSSRIKLPMGSELSDSRFGIMAFQPGNTTNRNIVDELRVMLNAVDMERKAREDARQSTIRIPLRFSEGGTDDTAKTKKVRIRATVAQCHHHPRPSTGGRTRGSTTGKNTVRNSDLKLDDRTFSSEVKHIMKQLDDSALENLEFRTPTFQIEETTKNQTSANHKSFFSVERDPLSNIVPGLHPDDEQLRIVSINSILKKKPKPE